MRHISDLKTQAETSVINWLFSVLSNTGAEDNLLIAKVLSTPICPVPVVQKDPWSQRFFFNYHYSYFSSNAAPSKPVK